MTSNVKESRTIGEVIWGHPKIINFTWKSSQVVQLEILTLDMWHCEIWYHKNHSNLWPDRGTAIYNRGKSLNNT